MKTIRIIVFIGVLGLVSCKKSELKKPADVQFRVAMESASNPYPVAHLDFTAGHLYMSKIIVEGDRVEGESISFTRNFSAGLMIDLSTNPTLEDLRFDIPQGTFSEMDITYETFAQGSGIAISVEGVYTNLSAQNIPFKFEFDAVEDFLLSAYEDGSTSIVLDKNIAEEPLISLNPGYWFETVSINLWENATLYDVDGVQTILITNEKNEEIYDIAVDRIDESGEVIFN